MNNKTSFPSMEPVVCLKCNTTNEFHIITKANNHVAYCDHCESYIKNIPFDDPRMYVGKYAGWAINDIKDRSYLSWALTTMRLSQSQKTAVQKKLAEL